MAYNIDINQLITNVHDYGINVNSREIYLHGHYGWEAAVGDSEPGVEYRMANSFIKNLNILERQSKTNILVRMMSVGGEWNCGEAIFSSIRQSPAPVAMIAYAQASSMSGVILQAADLRLLASHTTEYLIHSGSIFVDDSSIAAKSAVEINEKNYRKMLEIFSQRAVGGHYFQDRNFGVKQIARYIDRKIRDKSDWYVDPQQAIDLGLIDGVLGDKGFETIEKARRKCRKYRG